MPPVTALQHAFTSTAALPSADALSHRYIPIKLAISDGGNVKLTAYHPDQPGVVLTEFIRVAAQKPEAVARIQSVFDALGNKDYIVLCTGISRTGAPMAQIHLGHNGVQSGTLDKSLSNIYDYITRKPMDRVLRWNM